MDGMILNDSVAVLAMDNTVSGLYVPVGTSKKDNALKGNLISLKQLADLEKKADDILRDMAKGLHSGRIAALPFKKDKITGCDYCDYSQVCSHEEDSPYRELGSLNFSEALEIIEKGDKQ